MFVVRTVEDLTSERDTMGAHFFFKTKIINKMKSNISLSFSVAFEKSDMTGEFGKDSLEARIAGLSHYVDMNNYTNYSIEGGYIKAEPDNIHDPNAISIYHESGKHIGYIAKECILGVKEFTDGETAPCLIYIAPFMDNEGEEGFKGVVRIFRYYDGETDYVNSMMEHYLNVYIIRLKDAMEEFERKVDNKYKALLSDNEDDNNHIKFKGIPVNGTAMQVRAKIINVGFEPDGEPLIGRFAGLKVKVYVGSDAETELAYCVMVVSEQEKSWESLKQKYLNVRELYIRKYGVPATDSQTFGDPYSEGWGDELEATDKLKCFYKCMFQIPGGEVSIGIVKRSIMFCFEDTINKSLVEEYKKDDFEDFDDDYDAYDDI